MSVSILGLNIKKIRTEKGISAFKLSKLAHIGASTVSEIESGKRFSLNSNTIEKIAGALDVTIDALMTPEENTEYIVKDLEQTMATILSIKDLMLDGTEITHIEKEQIKRNLALTLQSIRNQRDITRNIQISGRINRYKK